MLSSEPISTSWLPSGSLDKPVIAFVRNVLLKVAGKKPLSWFYERTVKQDGYREVSPGGPSKQYFEGQMRGCIKLREDVESLVVWASEGLQNPLDDTPIPCSKFAVEIWNKRTRRVDAALGGVIYGLTSDPKTRKNNIYPLLISA